MENENKKAKKYLSSSLTIRSVSILLIFSSIVTILAFAVAYNEHRKITVLSQKYDEALVKINNCEEVLGALVSQMENTDYSEVTVTPEPEEEYEDAVPETTTQISTTTQPYATTQSQTTSSAEKPSVTTTKENITTTEKTTSQTTTFTEKPQKTTATTSVASTSGTYFVTQSGTKYHVGSCSYLSKSKIPITMDRIKAGGYSPCSRCIK